MFELEGGKCLRDRSVWNGGCKEEGGKKGTDSFRCGGGTKGAGMAIFGTAFSIIVQRKGSSSARAKGEERKEKEEGRKSSRKPRRVMQRGLPGKSSVRAALY